MEFFGLKICIGGCWFFICIWVLYCLGGGIWVDIVLVGWGWYIDIGGGGWDYEGWLVVGDGCGGLL